MKVVVFSDLHLDTQFRWAGAEGARRRRQSIRDTLVRICELVHEQRADALLCAGDLYENERFSPDTAAFVAATFNDLGLPVFLAPGNHDWYGPSSLYKQAEWNDNVHVFTEARLTAFELADGLTLWGAGHRAPANTDGFLDGFRVDRSGVHIALFHGSERGGMQWQEDGKVPHAPFTEDQVPAAGLDHAFVGHFHTPRDSRWHTYPGNPEPLTFGESGERGAVVATIGTDGSVARERHVVAAGQMHDIEIDLTGIEHAQDLRDRVCGRLGVVQGAARITLRGDVPPQVEVTAAGVAALADHLDGVVVRTGALSIAYDFEHLRQEATVRGQFVRDVLDNESLDDTTKRKVLVTGLRAFDGRDDLEVM